MRSVFVGRFQPVHNGHIHTIRQILDKGEELIIAIGSAQHSHTPDNPFSGGERVLMIKQALIEEGFPLKSIDIIPVPDININPLWVAHLKSLVPPFDKIYSHNPLVRRLMDDFGMAVGTTTLLERSSFSGHHIRELIRDNDPSWESLVPPVVARLIKDYHLDERIRAVGTTRIKR